MENYLELEAEEKNLEALLNEPFWSDEQEALLTERLDAVKRELYDLQQKCLRHYGSHGAPLLAEMSL
tara:strand:- start:978 stop:1178 length:201 start_codon:yes stop_codon:yes gene_type:complete